jgi:hypothetical protein
LVAVVIEDVGLTNQGWRSIVVSLGGVTRGDTGNQLRRESIVVRRRRLRRGLPLLRLLPLLRRPVRRWCWLVSTVIDIERVH